MTNWQMKMIYLSNNQDNGNSAKIKKKVHTTKNYTYVISTTKNSSFFIAINQSSTWSLFRAGNLKNQTFSESFLKFRKQFGTQQ